MSIEDADGKEGSVKVSTKSGGKRDCGTCRHKLVSVNGLPCAACRKGGGGSDGALRWQPKEEAPECPQCAEPVDKRPLEVPSIEFVGGDGRRLGCGPSFTRVEYDADAALENAQTFAAIVSKERDELRAALAQAEAEVTRLKAEVDRLSLEGETMYAEIETLLEIATYQARALAALAKREKE